ncbi:MAG: hypothetical protein KBS60_06365 [Phascolarctobacterium sp.]|nr:hypothetical protein [Candidatus Phascolarctobacterium caballi]
MGLKQSAVLALVEKEFGRSINCCSIDGGYLFLVKKDDAIQVVAAVQGDCAWAEHWQTEKSMEKDGVMLNVLKINANNAALVRRYIKWTAPSACGTMGISIGITDSRAKMGTAAAESFKNRQIKPVFGDCSPEKLQAEQRNLLNMADDATWGVLEADYREGYGINAAGLKTEEEIVKALLYGYSMIGVDATDKIVQDNVKLSDEEIAKKFEAFPIEFQAAVNASYLNVEFQVGKHKISFKPKKVRRIVLEYGEVIMHIQYIYNTYLKPTPWPIDFELELRRDGRPLTVQEHYLIANELERNGVRLTSFLFDMADNLTDAELQLHAEIANTFEYRLSLANADLGNNDYTEFLKIAKNKGHFKVKSAEEAVKLLNKI